jgi:arginine deiminase
MQKQHTDFIKKLKITAHRPIVLEVGLLLFDVIKNSNYEERRLIIENILLNRELQNLMKCFNQYKLNLSQILKEKIDELCECDARKITLDLLRGINIADFLLENSDPSLFTRKGCQVIQPIPNLYFTRDPAFALGDSIILGRMYWPIRKREPSIFREIIMRHPFMASAKPTLMDWNTQKDETFFVEGGDVMAIENGTYVIAESERTTRQSIRKIVTELFKRESAKCIYQPVIPAKRAFIHLDTVCSLVGSDKVIVHPEAIKAYGTTLKWTPENMSDGEFIPEFHHETLTEILEKKHGKTLIETAGGGPSARLEQFDDATNVFMVNDKKAIVYDRNRYTNLVLQSFVDTAEFSGPDLVMGRGGPRCMTMPLNRD